ncbi:MAG TPA: hypothetical protein V6D02_15275, partial [Candidatus Obscuribacterales bacterium]
MTIQWSVRVARPLGFSVMAACLVGMSGCALGQREAGGPGQAARADEIAAVDAAPATVGDG